MNKEKFLAKILELFASLPDSKDDIPMEEPKEDEGALEIVDIGAKPLGKDQKKVC